MGSDSFTGSKSDYTAIPQATFGIIVLLSSSPPRCQQVFN